MSVCYTVSRHAAANSPHSYKLNPSPTHTNHSYGYGYLTVHNATHASWRWRTSVPHAGSPDPFYSDTLELVVSQHGPRPPPQA